MAEGFVKRAVADGQTVVVRYDPAQPMTGTVVSQSTPPEAGRTDSPARSW